MDHYLVGVASEPHTLRVPVVEVVLNSDATARPLGLTDGPELVEGGGTVDGGLVDTLGLADLVRAAVGGDTTLLLTVLAGVVGAVVFNDVVFDEGVAGPAIDGKVCVTLRVEGA